MISFPECGPAVKRDCRHYRGHLPCAPHKRSGVHCDDCTSYEATAGDLLIIKLGARGDVIRTTPLLHRLHREFPQHRIHWLTDFPDALPREPWLDRVYRFDARDVMTLESISFDAVYCLDKDIEAAALATRLTAARKFGYLVKDNVVTPATVADCGYENAAEAARFKWLTGLFDDLSKANRLSYQQEIFAICGYEFAGEEYILPPLETHQFALPPRGKRIGLNTGCGGRWLTRRLPEAHWHTLIELLQKEECHPVLLGGPEEDDVNRRLHAATGAQYYGTMPLAQFDALLSEMDVLVTAVTMALHIAIGRRVPVVMFNNIFNRYEFELYGRGEILEPEPPCRCYYAAEGPFGGCMQNIAPKRVLAAVNGLLRA